MKLILLIFLCLVFYPFASTANIIAAGVPQSISKERNYERIFQHLENNNISLFLPTFQYEEIPEPLSLGYENDFTDLCNKASPVIRALEQSQIQLVLPVSFFYKPTDSLPSPDEDPLSKTYKCASQYIAGFSNFDEPITNNISYKTVSAIYEKIKNFAPNKPVFMVHAPVVDDHPHFKGRFFKSKKDVIKNYLLSVVKYSQASDVAGFNAYSYPNSLSKIVNLSTYKILDDPNHTIKTYIEWSRTYLAPAKDTLFVMQGFNIKDLYSSDFLNTNFDPDFLKTIPSPSFEHIQSVLKYAKEYEIDYIAIWGQSALTSEETEPWSFIIAITGQQHDN